MPTRNRVRGGGVRKKKSLHAWEPHRTSLGFILTYILKDSFWLLLLRTDLQDVRGEAER